MASWCTPTVVNIDIKSKDAIRFVSLFVLLQIDVVSWVLPGRKIHSVAPLMLQASQMVKHRKFRELAHTISYMGRRMWASISPSHRFI
jgi:hypothetical protein